MPGPWGPHYAPIRAGRERLHAAPGAGRAEHQVHTDWPLPAPFTFSCRFHPLPFSCPLNLLRTHWSDSRDLLLNSHLSVRELGLRFVQKPLPFPLCVGAVEADSQLLESSSVFQREYFWTLVHV